MRRKGTPWLVAALAVIGTAASTGCGGATSDDDSGSGGQDTDGTGGQPVPHHFDCVCSGTDVPTFATQDLAECLQACESYESMACPSFIGLNTCPGLDYTIDSETRQGGSPCLITLGSDPLSLVNLNIAVDCEIIAGYEMGGAGGADGGWVVHTETSPLTVELWGSICEQVEEGYERIDIVLGCSGPL